MKEKTAVKNVYWGQPPIVCGVRSGGVEGMSRIGTKTFVVGSKQL